MIDKVSEDVADQIARALIRSTKGENLTRDEKKAQRQLRNSTLLNMALSSKERSDPWIKALHYHVTASILTSERLLPRLARSPASFLKTRSLNLDLEISRNDYTDEMGDRLAAIQTRVDHPGMYQLQDYYFEMTKRAPGEAPPTFLDPKVHSIGVTLMAQIYSLMIESMPNIQFLRATDEIMFQFVVYVQRQGTDIVGTRPLRGLKSLKTLQLGPWNAYGYSATNGIWLMTFLENLSHLQISLEFHSKDEKFMTLHKKVLNGISKVTHLDLSFKVARTLKWPGQQRVESEILEQFLSITKGLIELKLKNTTPTLIKVLQVPSNQFLRSLKRAFGTLKYLSLAGDFYELMGADQVHSSIEFGALEYISIGMDGVDAFLANPSQPNFKLKVLNPKMKSLHLYSEPKARGDKKFPENNLSFWLTQPSFPSYIKEVIVTENSTGADGEVIEMGSNRLEWKRARLNLREQCLKKGVNFTVLKEGERLPYGRLPQPEDFE